MTTTWDPTTYLGFADERGRPFVDLIARVAADDPARIVDLGCGAGNLTRLLADRWPGAHVSGIDSSPEMVARARADEVGGDRRRPTFEVGDVREWSPSEPVDVLTANAVLQWVPGHLDLLPQLVSGVAPGGWLALQVPGNFDQPSHTIRDDLAAEPRYAEHVRGVERPASHDPATYLEALGALGCTVDAWETTYLHLLGGDDPVFRWVSGTGARPVLQALPSGLRADFEAELARRLRAAYPPGPAGVVLPFRRVFVVAQVLR